MKSKVLRLACTGIHLVLMKSFTHPVLNTYIVKISIKHTSTTHYSLHNYICEVSINNQRNMMKILKPASRGLPNSRTFCVLRSKAWEITENKDTLTYIKTTLVWSSYASIITCNIECCDLHKNNNASILGLPMLILTY